MNSDLNNETKQGIGNIDVKSDNANKAEAENDALAAAEKAVQRANFAVELAVIAVIAALISIILTFVASNKPAAVPADYEAVSSKISSGVVAIQENAASRIDGVRGGFADAASDEPDTLTD